MNGENLDWRSKLRDWLARNPKTAPEASRELREQFIQRFPKEGLAQLTLEQYALGHDDSEKSFCYWLEYETTDLGSIQGGNVKKFWVWWDQEKKDWQWIKGMAENCWHCSARTSSVAGLFDLAMRTMPKREPSSGYKCPTKTISW